MITQQSKGTVRIKNWTALSSGYTTILTGATATQMNAGVGIPCRTVDFSVKGNTPVLFGPTTILQSNNQGILLYPGQTYSVDIDDASKMWGITPTGSLVAGVVSWVAYH